MSNKTPLSPPPLAREVVGRLLTTLKRVGTDEQRKEAQQIEDVLYQHFYQPEAVSFATATEEPAQPAPEDKK